MATRSAPHPAPPDAPTTDRSGSPAVLLRSVTRVFGVTPALVRADLRIKPGETVLIRGSNGAGKSTLMNVMATLLSPTYGSGSVLGFDLTREAVEIRRRTELVGHRTRLYEDLSAVENLRFTCRLFGADPAGIAPALERVGLADVAGERVRGYSQGMRQRVAVARAALRSPELLLLDEPYAGLDAQSREAVDALVDETHRRGGTVVLATHEPTRGSMAGRILFMEAGRLLPDPSQASVTMGGEGR